DDEWSRLLAARPYRLPQGRAAEGDGVGLGEGHDADRARRLRVPDEAAGRGRSCGPESLKIERRRRHEETATEVRERPKRAAYAPGARLRSALEAELVRARRLVELAPHRRSCADRAVLADAIGPELVRIADAFLHLALHVHHLRVDAAVRVVRDPDPMAVAHE